MELVIAKLDLLELTVVEVLVQMIARVMVTVYVLTVCARWAGQDLIVH